MKISGAACLVTGGQTGLGAALAAELLEKGAAKVYVASRHPQSDDDPRIIPLALDVTDPAQVRSIVELADDVSVVVNNAGAYTNSSLLTAPAADLRQEFETNVLGPLWVARAFAPVLASHGGGALLNVHSVLSWLSFGDGYSASKAAAWSVTNGLRALLAPAGTLVVGLHLGYIDTAMVAHMDVPKNDPRNVARSAVQGLLDDATEVLADDFTRTIKAALVGDPRNLAVPAPSAPNRE